MSRSIKIRNIKGDVIRKEKIYSHGPLYFINKGRDNSIFEVAASWGNDNIDKRWMSYWHEAIVMRNDPRDKEESPYEIMRNIRSEDIRKEFIATLFEADYDPFTSPIPYCLFSENVRKNIEKTVAFIERSGRIFSGFNVNGKNILVSYWNHGDPVMAEFYLKRIDAVILIKYSGVLIKTNEDADALLERLNDIESGVWVKRKNNGIATSNKSTGLDFTSRACIEKIFGGSGLK